MLDIIKDSEGMTQDSLKFRTGFSKSKVRVLLTNLENRDIVSGVSWKNFIKVYIGNWLKKRFSVIMDGWIIMGFMKGKKFGLALILTVFLLYFYISGHGDLSKLSNIESVRKFIISFGVISPIVYMLIMAIAIVVSPIPCMPLATASGVLFGPTLGTIYSLIGAEIGAIIAFYIARAFGRGFIEGILHRHINFFGSRAENYIAYFIFFSRLLPIFNFGIISYGAGLTNITLKKFAAATFFGMIPMTFLFAYYGQVIFFGNLFSVIFSTLLIIAIFSAPVLIGKYNIFGLKDKIELK